MIYVNNAWLHAAAASDQLGELNIHSHQTFQVTCDFHVSDKCRDTYNIEYRRYLKVIKENDNKLICLFCSRAKKFSNRNNPNTKYTTINDNYFNKIDTKEKAYLLGWIASDGHIGKRGFKISIHRKDIDTLKELRDLICEEIPIKLFVNGKSPMCSFEVNSQQISKDLCTILQITPGKKSAKVNFPILSNDILQLSFLKGYYEGDGSINDPEISKYSYPKGNIRSNSQNMLNGIKQYLKISASITCNTLSLSNRQLMKFLHRIYNVPELPTLKRKYDRYLKWCKLSQYSEKH